MNSDTPAAKNKIEKLEKERDEVISKIKDLEKNYSSGDLIDEEYEELRKPLDNKINEIDKVLKNLGENDLEKSTSFLSVKDKKDSTESIENPVASASEEQLKTAYGAIFFIAGLSIVVGIVAELFKVEFLLQRGMDYFSILYGVLFLVLGFYVKRRSNIALGIAVGLYALDAILSVIMFGITSSIGVIMWRIFLLPLMIKGFDAISSLKEEERMNSPQLR